MASDVRPARAKPHRLKRLRQQGLKPPVLTGEGPMANAVLDCGWGRLLFAQTFDTAEPLVEALRAEGPDRRDIAFYVRNPHVLLAQAPQEVFLDPSHTYRPDLATYRASRRQPRGFTVRRLTSEADARAVNEIYAKRRMVQVPPDFFWSRPDDRTITYFVAEDIATGAVIGTVTGVNHVRAFQDPEGGSSLWCLAVDPQATQPGRAALPGGLADIGAGGAIAKVAGSRDLSGQPEVPMPLDTQAMDPVDLHVGARIREERVSAGERKRRLALNASSRMSFLTTSTG